MLHRKYCVSVQGQGSNLELSKLRGVSLKRKFLWFGDHMMKFKTEEAGTLKKFSPLIIPPEAAF